MNFVGCVIIFAWNDEAGVSANLEVPIISMVNSVVFATSYYTGHPLAYFLVIYWVSYFQTFLLAIALPPTSPSKTSTLQAGAVITWMCHCGMVAVNLLLPPDIEGVHKNPEDARPEGNPYANASTHAP